MSLAFAAPVVGQLGREGYSSFRAFKRAEGLAAAGFEWHHIVEQTPGNIERFGPYVIHNLDNMIQVPTKIHRGVGSISAYYSGADAFTEGLTVRKWLAPQSFEAHREFGLKILRDRGLIR